MGVGRGGAECVGLADWTSGRRNIDVALSEDSEGIEGPVVPRAPGGIVVRAPGGSGGRLVRAAGGSGATCEDTVGVGAGGAVRGGGAGRGGGVGRTIAGSGA